MPNYKCIESINNKEQLKEKLISAITKVDARSIRIDLGSLIDNPELVRNLSKNIKEILKRMIEAL